MRVRRRDAAAEQLPFLRRLPVAARTSHLQNHSEPIECRVSLDSPFDPLFVDTGQIEEGVYSTRPKFPIDSARLARFELATPGFVGRCSIQMSYSRS